MKNTLWYLIIFLFLLLFQTAVLPNTFSLLDEALNIHFFSSLSIPLLYILVIYLSFTRPFFDALTWAIFFCFLFHGFSELWRYSNFFVFSIIVFLGAILKNSVVIDHSLNSFFFFFIFIFVSDFLHVIFGALLYEFDVQYLSIFFPILIHATLGAFAAQLIVRFFCEIDRKTFFFRDSKSNFFFRDSMR
ncbi:MAG: hypothetical protein R3A11_07775 [Bdellovibrionota bacterium]